MSTRIRFSAIAPPQTRPTTSISVVTGCFIAKKTGFTRRTFLDRQASRRHLGGGRWWQAVAAGGGALVARIAGEVHLARWANRAAEALYVLGLRNVTRGKGSRGETR